MRYKNSNFNYFIVYKDHIIGMNLITKKPFILSESNSHLYYRYKDDLSKLENENIYLYKALRKLGVIVNNKLNEIELVKMINHTIVFNNSDYILTINPTLNCNFSCWYCYEGHPKEKMSSKTIESIEKYLFNIVKCATTKKLQLDWFGGEPLLCFSKILYPLTHKVKTMAHENNVQFESAITTNGYLIEEQMIPMFNEISLKSFQITLDGCKDLHNNIRKHNNTLPTYDKIIKNINLLCEHIPEPKLDLRINYTPEVLSSIGQIINDFPIQNRDKISISFQKVWQIKNHDFDDIAELEKLKDLFIEAGFKWGNTYFKNKYYSCYADLKNQAVINYDGRVFKCTARDFETTPSDGFLDDDGEIHWNEELLHKRMAKSTFDNRNCLDCNLLPACLGPCSQKIIELKNEDAFSKICNKEGLVIGLNTYLQRFFDLTTN